MPARAEPEHSGDAAPICTRPAPSLNRASPAKRGCELLPVAVTFVGRFQEFDLEPRHGAARRGYAVHQPEHFERGFDVARTDFGVLALAGKVFDLLICEWRAASPSRSYAEGPGLRFPTNRYQENRVYERGLLATLSAESMGADRRRGTRRRLPKDIIWRRWL